MTRTDAPTPWEAGVLILDEFCVLRLLGAGSFGEVALVENERSGELYAVKRLVVRDPIAQGRFLLEAQRWINIPAHPHIVGCYFVRSIGDEVAVFSEYVSGGSLADWISSRRLYEVDSPLDAALRIAVQSAWGLDAAHRLGLLHLDVKPGNVLLDDDCRARIADFGLAAEQEYSARERAELEAVVDWISDIPDTDESRREIVRDILRQQLFAPQADTPVEISEREGLTPAYSAPEQAHGGVLTRATDVYGWAASILEMFVGKRTWPAGPDAGIALTQIVRRPDSVAIAIPTGMAELLHACLRDDPGARPAVLGEIAEQVAAVYETELGRPLGLEAPAAPAVKEPKAQILGSDSRITWSEPRSWLSFAYEAAGRDVQDAVEFWPKALGTLKAQALEDLRALSEARRVFEPVAGARGADGVRALARLHTDVGRVRTYLGDAAGAILEYERAVAVLEGEPPAETLLEHAGALNGLAILLRDEERLDESLAASGRAIELCRNTELDDAGHSMLGTSLLTDANTRLGSEEALLRHDEACAEFELANDGVGLVRALAAKASALERTDPERAAEAWTRADALLDRLIEGGRRDLRSMRATTFLNRAIAAREVGDQLRHALAAIDLYTPLVVEEGMHRLVDELGNALFTAGVAHEHAGRPQDALEAYGAARHFLEQAVVRDGRSDLTDELARAYDFESTLLAASGRTADAVAAAGRAVEMWSRLTRLDGEDVWATELALAESKLASSLGDAGDDEAALRAVDEAIRLLEPRAESDAARRVLARALSARGSVMRRGGDLQAALDCHHAALDILRDLPHVEDRRDEARVLESIGNALADGGNHAAGIDAVLAALEIHKGLGQDERSLADLVASYHNLANKLVKGGDNAGALEAGELAADLYDDLVGRGRTDLAAERARLLMMQGITLQHAADPEAALAVLRKAQAAYLEITSLDSELLGTIRSMLDQQLETLQDLAAAEPSDLARWLERAQQKVEIGEMLSRQAEPEQACTLLEEAAGWLVYLAENYPDETVLYACGDTSVKLGLVAFYAGRSALAFASFTIAVNCFRFRLQERVDPERVADLAKAHYGLVTVLAAEGDSEGADTLAAEMDDELRPLDPKQADEWRARALEIRSQLGGGS